MVTKRNHASDVSSQRRGGLGVRHYMLTGGCLKTGSCDPTSDINSGASDRTTRWYSSTGDGCPASLFRGVCFTSLTSSDIAAGQS